MIQDHDGALLSFLQSIHLVQPAAPFIDVHPCKHRVLTRRGAYFPRLRHSEQHPLHPLLVSWVDCGKNNYGRPLVFHDVRKGFRGQFLHRGELVLYEPFSSLDDVDSGSKCELLCDGETLMVLDGE